jgi:hypothetical protein
MSNLNIPRIGAVTTPDSPSAPPVRLVALLAISKRTEVIARVSISSVSALVRRMIAPVVRPRNAPAAAAAASCIMGSVIPAFAASMPAT